jgi:hypothetical protein
VPMFQLTIGGDIALQKIGLPSSHPAVSDVQIAAQAVPCALLVIRCSCVCHFPRRWSLYRGVVPGCLSTHWALVWYYTMLSESLSQNTTIIESLSNKMVPSQDIQSRSLECKRFPNPLVEFLLKWMLRRRRIFDAL